MKSPGLNGFPWTLSSYSAFCLLCSAWHFSLTSLYASCKPTFNFCTIPAAVSGSVRLVPYIRSIGSLTWRPTKHQKERAKTCSGMNECLNYTPGRAYECGAANRPGGCQLLWLACLTEFYYSAPPSRCIGGGMA